MIILFIFITALLVFISVTYPCFGQCIDTIGACCCDTWRDCFNLVCNKINNPNRSNVRNNRRNLNRQNIFRTIGEPNEENIEMNELNTPKLIVFPRRTTSQNSLKL